MKTKKNKLILIPVFISTILLITSAYAWFTYFSDVDSTLTGHVIGWNIDFDGKTNIENEYEITINNIYPGMDDFKNEFNINNSGEAAALITTDIKWIKVFEETYEFGEEYDGVVLTNDNFIDFLNDKYPFKINMNVDKDIIRTNETSVFTFNLTWEFETYVTLKDDDIYDPYLDYYILNGTDYELTNVTKTNFSILKNTLYILNDREDTYWGSHAYDFKDQNPDDPCIELKFMINATQYIE